jgi:deazaflavin-dependent oxidoreductase (nitroreductase family)
MSEPSPFPDVRWGGDRSPLRSPAAAFAATKAGSWLVRTLTPLDRRILVRSRGRRPLLGPIGAPVLLLTTTGRKTGQPRTTPLLYVRHGARVCVAGSNFGQERHPLWSENLLADARATVTIGGKDVPVRASLLDGEERDRVYDGFIELARTYDAYRDRTSRHIRVFALEAVARE